jgi:outer membrane protein assembly factor BamE (lipoprotein component of BamABCDE complex)|tara:strand:+ start:54 stop:527 length:474 start_codon:yes stop_codon:yes gene_type:complete
MIKNFLIFILTFVFFANCSLSKVEKRHGTPFLEKKEKLLLINKTNKNDILRDLGSPSTQSFFDKDIWIYIEKITTTDSLIRLGRKNNLVSNVLVLEINNKGLLSSKKIYSLKDINNLNFTAMETTKTEKDSFVYGVLSNLRQKIDSPKRRRSNTKKQ